MVETIAVFSFGFALSVGGLVGAAFSFVVGGVGDVLGLTF